VTATVSEFKFKFNLETIYVPGRDNHFAVDQKWRPYSTTHGYWCNCSFRPLAKPDLATR
jgi:hypothetical protein